MKTLFFAIGMCVSASALGQCDPSFMFEKLPWPKPPLELLKPYSIPVRAQAGVPFSVQYSILFGKGKNYIFCIKQIGKGKSPLKFTATNSKNEVVKCDTLENFGEDGVMLGFEAELEDTYNLNLHSAHSFDGCIIFLVSWLTETEKMKQGWKITVPTIQEFPGRKTVEKDTVVKKFEFRPNSSSRYAIELEAGQLYGIKVLDEEGLRNLSFHVSSPLVTTYVTSQDKGFMCFFRTTRDGVHGLDFLNSSNDRTLTAYLVKAKSRK